MCLEVPLGPKGASGLVYYFVISFFTGMCIYTSKTKGEPARVEASGAERPSRPTTCLLLCFGN